MLLVEPSQFTVFSNTCKKISLDTFDHEYQAVLLPLAHRLAAFRVQQTTIGLEAYRAYVAWCIPLWEALFLHTSLFSPLKPDPAKHALLLQTIGFVYPDASDRRCFFRAPNLRGDDAEKPGHLHIPTLSLPQPWQSRCCLLTEIASEADPSLSTLTKWCQALEQLLRHLRVVGTDTAPSGFGFCAPAGEAATRAEDSIAPSAGGDIVMVCVSELRRVLLVFAMHAARRRETATLIDKLLKVLQDPAFRSGTITCSDGLVTRGDIFADLEVLVPSLLAPVKSAIPGAEAMSPAHRDANANWWRLASRVAAGANSTPGHTRLSAPPVALLAGSSLCLESEDESLSREPYAQRMCRAHCEKTEIDIPASVQFSDDGTSPELRDTDQLVRYLRTMTQLSLMPDSKQTFRRLLFSRQKRPRSDGTMAIEGRVLLPVCESLGESALGSASTAAERRRLTVQERVILFKGTGS